MEPAEIARIVNSAGLILDLAGALVLTVVLFTSPAKAIELGVTKWASKDSERALQLPAVRDRLSQSRHAKVGAVLLCLGFSLQLLAAWVK